MKSGNSPAAKWLSTRNLVLAGLLVFTLIVRGAALWAMRGNLNQDPDAYREIAEFLLERGEFAVGKLSPFEGGSRPIPTAYRPPLYPVVLGNLPATSGKQISLAKVAALHLVLGAVTVWLTWLTTARYLVCRASLEGLWHVPFLAGLLVACDPILLNQQSLVMTETLAAFLTILALWCLARFDGNRDWFNAGLAGGTIGLAVLCRPTFLPWLGLVGLVMLFVRGRKSEIKSQKSGFQWFDDLGWRFGNVAGLVVGFAAITSPWAIRNYRVFGKPMITTTHGGYTLYLGNNEWFYSWLKDDTTGLPWDARVFQARLWSRWSTNPASFSRAELVFDDLCYKSATQTISKQREMFLRACAYRVTQLWSPLPHKLTKDESTGRKLLRYATAVWYCGVYVLAAIGIWRLRWQVLQPPWIWGVLLCLAFTAVHTFYWTNLRMRAPLMPFIAMLAAAATISSKIQVSSSKLLNPEP
jgi:hypothetical protein